MFVYTSQIYYTHLNTSRKKHVSNLKNLINLAVY